MVLKENIPEFTLVFIDSFLIGSPLFLGVLHIKFPFFLFALGFWIISGPSTGNGIDTTALKFKRQIQQANSDSLRLEAITQWFWEINLSQPERADSLTNIELSMARKMNSRYWTSMAWNDKAILAIRHSAFATALEYLNKSLEIRQKMNDPALLASTYYKLGSVNAQINQHQKALPYLFQALRYYQQSGRKNESGIVLAAIGTAFIHQKDPEKGIQYLNQSAALHKETGDLYSYHMVQANIANAWSELGQPKRAIPLLLACEKEFEKMGDIGSLSNVLISLGLCYRQMSDAKTGLRYYGKAYALALQNKDEQGQAILTHNIGSVFLDREQLDSARHYFTISARLCDKWDLNQEGKMLAFSFLKMILRPNKEASTWLQRFKNYSDSLDIQQNRAFAQEMDVKYQSELREAKIKNLANENRVKQLEIRDKENRLRQTQYLIGLLILLAILLSAAAFFYFSQLKIQNQLKLTALKAEEEQKALQAVIDAQEQERTLIAAELHDSIGQQLGALKFRIADNEPAAKMLHQSMEELRQISHRMMPLALNRYGLVVALEELFDQTLKPAGIQYSFQTIQFPESIPEKISLTLYRVAQEWVQNLLKHAQASEVSVLLQFTTGRLIFSFEDNGKGLDPTNLTPGMGLKNMQTRLAQIGGQYQFEPGETKGLRQWVRIDWENQK